MDDSNVLENKCLETIDEFNEDYLKYLYKNASLIEEERKDVRLWVPKIPCRDILPGTEDLILKNFKEKSECMKSGRVYINNIEKDSFYEPYLQKEDTLEDFSKNNYRIKAFKCKNIRKTLLFLVNYRKNLKKKEFELVEIYNLLENYNTIESKRKRVLIKSNILHINQIISKTFVFQNYLCDVCTISEDVLQFLVKACKATEIKNLVNLEE